MDDVRGAGTGSEAGARVLIVEEDRVESGVLAFHLRHRGFVPLTVASEEEAADALGWGAPRAILCDLEGPHVDGLRLARKLEGVTVSYFLVADRALTAREELEALRLGVADVFRKPLDEEIVTDRIATRAPRPVGPRVSELEDGAIPGALEHTPIERVLRLCHRHRLDARLHVERSDAGDWDVLWVRKGEVVDAEGPAGRGRPSALDAIRRTAGRFVLHPLSATDPEAAREDVIHEDLPALLMEAAGDLAPVTQFELPRIEPISATVALPGTRDGVQGAPRSRPVRPGLDAPTETLAQIAADVGGAAPAADEPRSRVVRTQIGIPAISKPVEPRPRPSAAQHDTPMTATKALVAQPLPPVASPTPPAEPDQAPGVPPSGPLAGAAEVGSAPAAPPPDAPPPAAITAETAGALAATGESSAGEMPVGLDDALAPPPPPTLGPPGDSSSGEGSGAPEAAAPLVPPPPPMPAVAAADDLDFPAPPPGADSGFDLPMGPAGAAPASVTRADSDAGQGGPSLGMMALLVAAVALVGWLAMERLGAPTPTGGGANVQADAPTSSAAAAGDAAWKAGRFDDAVAQYERALGAQPGDARLTLSLGQALYKAGRADDALPVLEKAATLDPDAADAHMLVGVLSQKLGERDRAKAAFTRLLALLPAGDDADQVRLLLDGLDVAPPDAEPGVAPEPASPEEPREGSDEAAPGGGAAMEPGASAATPTAPGAPAERPAAPAVTAPASAAKAAGARANPAAEAE